MKTPQFSRRADGSESWKIRFRHRGKETSRTFASERGARRFADMIDKLGLERALEIVEARTAESPSAAPTMREWCEQYIDTLTGVGNASLRDYRRYAQKNLGNLANIPIDLITRTDIATWVNQTAAEKKPDGKPLSGKTIANRHGFIAGALNRAVRDELIKSNPCDATRLPRTVKLPMVFLTHDEYLRFIGCFPTWRRPMVATMFTTGLRWGELAALRVGDFDAERGTISVVQAWKDGGKELGAPKTDKSVRTVAIAPEVIDMLTPLTVGRSPRDWLFTGRNGDWVRYHTFRKEAWVPAVKLANGEGKVRDGGRLLPTPSPLLGKRPRIHDARHSCASWLLGAGVPINYVQAHLGHESIQTTVDRYGHVMPGAQHAIRHAISNAISAAHPMIEQ